MVDRAANSRTRRHELNDFLTTLQGLHLDHFKHPPPIWQAGCTVSTATNLPCSGERGLHHHLPGKRHTRTWPPHTRNHNAPPVDHAPQAQACFYRTSHGAELDLVLEFKSGDTWVIEIKRSSAPTVSKGFHIAANDVKPSRKLLVTPIDTTFVMRDAIEVMNPLMAGNLVEAQV